LRPVSNSLPSKDAVIAPMLGWEVCKASQWVVLKDFLGYSYHSRHAVSGSVDGVSAGLSTGDLKRGSVIVLNTILGYPYHRGNTSAGGIVGVHVDRQLGVLLPDCANQKGGRTGLEDAGILKVSAI
jgi:hypothetical protein